MFAKHKLYPEIQFVWLLVITTTHKSIKPIEQRDMLLNLQFQTLLGMQQWTLV